MKPLFQALIVLIAVIGLQSWAQSGAEGDRLLHEVTDLRVEGAHGMPILVEFALTGCRYCRVAEEDFLEPMIRSGAYENRVLIRKLRMDRGMTVVDFDGRTVPVREVAARYGARIAPTVVVLGPDGELLTDPVVGLKTVDFYGGYLDRAIDRAEEAMVARELPEMALR